MVGLMGKEMKMEIKTLWLALSRRHKGSLAGIFILILLLSVTLMTVLTVWRNAGSYVRGEMERLGFGEITAWVSGVPDIEKLEDEITALPEVERTGTQQIIFAEYEVNGQKSDSEGQLITYDPDRYLYKIFRDDIAGYQTGDVGIEQGEIYVSPSMQSMFGVEIGDEISFRIARNSVVKSFVVKGWFEDPFMGSSMIGMKGFLICEQDHEEIAQEIIGSGIDGLARDGYMVHIFQNGEELNTAEFNAALNSGTELLRYAEFTHSDSAIAGFMLTLQNVFTGLLLAFSLILLAVSLIVMGHSIGSAMEQDMVDTGILKTIGFTTKKLQEVQICLFLSPVLCGMALGSLLAIPAAAAVCRMTLTTTGFLMPSGIPVGLCLLVLSAVFIVLFGFVYLKTARIEKITPMRAIRRESHSIPRRQTGRGSGKEIWLSPFCQKGLGFWMAVRQLVAGRLRYMGVCFVAMLLVFFASLIGRIDSWLGSDGEGLMDAFNPADLHIAAQPFGTATNEDVEQVILSHTGITDQYMLAMPGVAVEGVDYTANVITEPERFHMLEGRTCTGEDEIVLTEFVAADLNVEVGDIVRVSGGRGTFEYEVSGIYQCANDMGANVGLSREGYQRIGRETSNMWCVHYFLEEEGKQAAVMQALEDTFGGDVYLHENSWPGLYGILSAMELLMYFMYGIVAAVVLVVISLTGSKLLAMEQKDLGIYKTIGFTSGKLRISFVLRFGIVSLVGAAAGILLSALLTDPFVAALLRMFGISNFSSHMTVSNTLFPAAAVIGLSAVFAWVVAAKVKNCRLVSLIEEGII
ncbi:MAG: ABC transporter permease [Lachnospiraceae bacterium]|nr:ABC transporter permease [Muribaculaceae bacterium]MCM1412494.1 ABC transporter permease [Lachnospiraceae bacterium]